VIHVVTAVITAKGDRNMNTLPEETRTAQAAAAVEKAKTGKKAARRPRRAPVAPAKGKSGKKASRRPDPRRTRL
jgi:hypothetical protein